MKFVVYKHSLVLGDNNIVTKQLIALKHDDGTLQFTDFHKLLLQFSYEVYERIKANKNLIRI